MKSLDEINRLLDGFSKKYRLPITKAQQGSEDWLALKLGVISASNASRAVAKKGTDTRATYMAELVAQICTGVTEDFESKYIDWGRQHEDAARASYEFENDTQVLQLPFVFKDDSYRVGCSPDALVSPTKGAEFKCPYNTVHFIKFLAGETRKPEYVWQDQFTIWVMEADSWDHVQFDPRMKRTPIHTLTIMRDEEKMKAFDDLIPAFISDMDAMLTRVGFKFGDQWERLAT